MTVKQSAKLFTLRAACRDIVEAIKGIKHLHKNLSQYISSDNEYIRAEYNKIRVFLGSALREISVVQENQDDPTAILSLDSIKLDMEENDSAANGMLDTLIRDSRISAQMATSLMNDSVYVYDVTKNLVQMGGALFARGDLSVKETERAVTLDTNEIEEKRKRIERELKVIYAQRRKCLKTLRY